MIDEAMFRRLLVERPVCTWTIIGKVPKGHEGIGQMDYATTGGCAASYLP